MTHILLAHNVAHRYVLYVVNIGDMQFASVLN